MNLTRETITTHFKLNAKNNLKSEGRYNAYVQGAEDCYDYIKGNEEKKISLDWESKCAELQLKLDGTITEYEEKLHARNHEIQTLKNKQDVLKAKIEIIEMIFGK